MLSGINGGSNVGEDMTYSGTVAAAMEATLLGIPAVALSQDYPRRLADPVGDRQGVRRRGGPPSAAAAVAREHADQRQFPGRAAGPGRRFCGDHARASAPSPTTSPNGTDPRGRPYYWIGPMRETGDAEPGTDIAALTENKVSITPINMDLTYIRLLDPLRKLFE